MTAPVPGSVRLKVERGVAGSRYPYAGRSPMPTGLDQRVLQ